MIVGCTYNGGFSNSPVALENCVSHQRGLRPWQCVNRNRLALHMLRAITTVCLLDPECIAKRRYRNGDVSSFDTEMRDHPHLLGVSPLPVREDTSIPETLLQHIGSYSEGAIAFFVDSEVHHVRFDGLVNPLLSTAQSGDSVDFFRQHASVGMVLRQPIYVVLESIDAGRREDADLTHSPTDRLPQTTRSGNELP